ncbi:MAG: chemotaxis protein CheD [Promethearchaeota archaeon]|nr:MAG: chemotaxis protein CheD [Candidatus Lokiarchaeota archaeon]
MINIKTYGRVIEFDRNNEVFLPIGHYYLTNFKEKAEKIYPKISIYGLGSCIALILIDFNNKVCGMSHILLPKANQNKKINYPHKYADLSLNLLVQELIDHGAVKEYIKAIIVGGSKIFDLDENIMGIDNTKSIKHELEKLKIKIVGEDTGGSRGRGVIFDTQDFSVYVKFTEENNYRKINLRNGML